MKLAKHMNLNNLINIKQPHLNIKHFSHKRFLQNNNLTFSLYNLNTEINIYIIQSAISQVINICMCVRHTDVTGIYFNVILKQHIMF